MQSASVWEAMGQEFLIVKLNWLAKWKQWNLLVGLWVTSRLSWKSGEPGLSRARGKRLSGHAHSYGRISETVCLATGHSLCPTAAAIHWTWCHTSITQVNSKWVSWLDVNLVTVSHHPHVLCNSFQRWREQKSSLFYFCALIEAIPKIWKEGFRILDLKQMANVHYRWCT